MFKRPWVIILNASVSLLILMIFWGQTDPNEWADLVPGDQVGGVTGGMNLSFPIGGLA